MIMNDFYRGVFFFSNYLMLHNRVIYTAMIFMLFVTLMKETEYFLKHCHVAKLICLQIIPVLFNFYVVSSTSTCMYFFYLLRFILLTFFSNFISIIYISNFFSLKQYSLIRCILKPIYISTVIFNVNYMYLSIYLHYYDLIVVLF